VIVNVNAPPRLLATAERIARVRMSGFLTALLAVGALVNPQRPVPIDLCLLKRLTGLDCPTCGLTRAVCSLLQGDWAASLSFHPAGILVVVSVAAWTMWSALEAWRGQAIWMTGRKTLARLAGAAIALLSLATWIVRL
jgi:hypothetical protein